MSVGHHGGRHSRYTPLYGAIGAAAYNVGQAAVRREAQRTYETLRDGAANLFQRAMNRGYKRPRLDGPAHGNPRFRRQRAGFFGRYATTGIKHTLRHAQCVEKKFKDITPWTAESITAGSVITKELFEGIGPGTGASQRVGQKMYVWSINLLGRIYKGGLTVNQPGMVKWIVVLDAMPDGTAPTWTEIYASNDVFAHRNLENTRRFKILKQGVANLQPQITSGTAAEATVAIGRNQKLINCNINFHGLPVLWDNADADGSWENVRSNSIFVIAKSMANGSDCFMELHPRVRYTD